MKITTLLLILISFTAISPNTARSAAPGASGYSAGAPCHTNCVSMMRSDNKLLFFARDSQGQIFATADLLLPADARPVKNSRGGRVDQLNPLNMTPQSGLPVGSACAGVAGVCTEHSSLTYETPTQYVIVSITYFFFNGELQDIDVDETRISKSKIK